MQSILFCLLQSTQSLNCAVLGNKSQVLLLRRDAVCAVGVALQLPPDTALACDTDKCPTERPIALIAEV